MNSTLNHIFRVVWCKARVTWVAVSEVVSGQGKVQSSSRRAGRPVTGAGQFRAANTRALWDGNQFILITLPPHPVRATGRWQTAAAWATTHAPRTLMATALVSGSAVTAQPAPTQLPNGGQVSAGQASISQSGANMVIQQASDRAAINWQSFNVGKDAQVQFQQPSASSVTLNRVMSADPSQIFGRITANGQVILTNPQGIYFGRDARVDVGGLIATTHSMGDADFMAGQNRFERNGSTASVVNEGELKASLGGYIALLAPEVRNQGAIIAQMGTVALAAGEAVDLRFDSNNRLTSIRVEPSLIQSLVDNRHAVQAPGGLIILSAQSMDRLLGGVVKNAGNIEATGLQQQGGRIVLSASKETDNSGTLNASSTQGQGGSISLQGDHIALQAGSRIDATGASGGGTVLVGGNWQGTTDPLLQATGQSTQTATMVTMEAGATIDASATDTGNGGTVVLWSDIANANAITSARGTILAKGGQQGGDGGQVETSGHWLQVDGAVVNASASRGRGGEWLLDPQNVTISDTYDNNYNLSDSGGTRTYLPNNDVSNVNVNTIANALNSGTSVTVTTGTTGAQLGDLTVNTALSKTSGNSDVTLTLRAANSIVINRNILHTGGSGKLNLVIDADNSNAGSTGGASPVRDGGGIVILEAHLSTGGGSVTFGGTTVTDYTGGDLFVGGGSGITISTSGGAVDVKGNLIIANSSTDGFTINTAGGAINLRRAVDSGNQYTAVAGDRTWQQAFDHARTQPNSWLATIGSSLENALAIRAAGYSAAWLGGQRIVGTNEWRWTADPAYNAATNPMVFFSQGSNTQTSLSGSEAGGGGTTASGYFTNWNLWTNGVASNSSEPNNWNGSTPGIFSQDNESVLQFTGTQGKWNDLPRTSTLLNKYVLETDLTPSRLTLNAGSGAVNLGAGVGFSKALSQLSVTSSSTSVTGGGIITTGAQSYSSGLTVENSGRVNISGTTVTTQGPVSVKSTTNDVYLNAAFTNTATTAPTFNVEAARHIQLSSNASIASSTAAMNTTLWADTDRSGDGIVYFEGSGIDTKGGSLTFGKAGQDTTVGSSTVLVGGDVFFQRGSAQTLTTGGGALNIYGETIVANTAGLNIISGNGNVTLHGLLNSGNQYTWVNKVGSTGAGSWDEARTEAKNGTSGGSATGASYLVNITSRLENAISGLTAGYQGAWIGAYRPNTNNYYWTWADGPEAGQTFFTQNSAGGGVATAGYYANYGTGEPNGGLTANRTQTESVGQFFGSAGLWNDLHHTTTYNNLVWGVGYAVKGYVRETNLAASPITINAGTGAVAINGGVGTTKALSTLTVTSSGTTVKGNGLITTGAQSYSSGLTVNDSSYVQAVNLQAGTGGMTVGGAMTVYGGAFEAIQLNTDITSTASGDLKFLGTESAGWSVRLAAGKTITKTAGSGTLTFAGPGRIMSEGTVQATGSGRLNVVMSAETDNGSIYGVGTGTITTNGGDVWIGGGSLTNTWNGLNVGSRWASGTTSGGNANAIDLGGNITTNGGDVLMAGWTEHAGALDITAVYGPVTISTGSGNVTLLSRSSKFAASTIAHKTTVNTTGTLTLAPLSGQGYNLGDLTVRGTTTGGHLTGTEDVTGLVVQNVSSLTGLVLGNYLGTGVTGDTAYSYQNNAITDVGAAFSINGPIGVYGTDIKISSNLSATAAGASVLVKAKGHIEQTAANVAVSTNGGSVTYWADSDADTTTYGQIKLYAGSSITTGGGNVTLSGGSDLATGYATYKATGSGNTADDAANTGAGIDLRNASISAGAGSVTLRGRSVGTSDDFSHGISVRGDNASASVTGGAITLTGISDNVSVNSAGSSNRGISLIETGTGSVAITGSGAVSLTGTGSAGTGGSGFNNRGVVLYGASVSSTDGAVTLTGAGRSSGGANMGVSVQNGQISATGGGISITGTGSSTATDQYNHGIWLENSTVSSNGAIAVTGTGGATSGTGSSDNYNVGLQLASTSITGTGTGAVTLTGTGGGRSNSTGNNKGIQVFGNSNVRSGAGSLTMTGTSGFNASSEGIALEGTSGQTNTLGSATAGQQTGNIKLQANTVWFGTDNTNQMLGTGTASIEPLNASFTSTFTTNGLTLGNSLTGLTLGKVSNTGHVTVANAISIAGPIRIDGGNIAINAGLTSTGTGTNALITLKASGNVTDGASGYVQTGSDGNGSLLLLGGNVTLDNSASNDVYALAASGVSGLTYLDKAALIVGTVGAVDGISATGVVNIGTQAGSFGITRSVTTTNTTSNALTLTASLGSALGGDLNYNLLISGNPTISVGSGGTAKLYTGSVTTAVTTLVGSGSGRFRYNSKLGSHNFTSVLGSGLYAIYREQPSLTITPDNQTITYGDSPALTTSRSGTVKNGDTLAMAVPNLPTAVVYNGANAAAVLASDDSTAYFDANSTPYVLRVGSLPTNSALGYALTTTALGTLTVSPKAITVQANNSAKFYSQSDPTAYAGVSYTGLAVGEQSAGNTIALSRAAAGTDPDNNSAVVSGETAGVYALAPSLATGQTANPNYTVTYQSGSFTIVPVAQALIRTGTTSPASDVTTRVYGTEAPATVTGSTYVTAPNSVTVASGSASGFAVGDTITLLDGATTLGTARVLSNTAGLIAIETNVDFAAVTQVKRGSDAAVATTGRTVLQELQLAALNVDRLVVADSTRFAAGDLVSQGTATGVVRRVDSSSRALTIEVTAGSFVNGVDLANTTQSANTSAVTAFDPLNTLYAFKDGVGKVLTLGIDAAGRNSGTQLFDVGTYTLQTQDLVIDAGLSVQGVKVNGSLNVTPRSLTLSGSKVYDGSAGMTVTLGNLASNESLNQSGVVLNSKDAGTGYVQAITLADGGTNGVFKASNYALPSLAQAATSVNEVTIARRALSISASKVYDGNTAIDVNTVAVDLGAVSGNAHSGLVAGESLLVTAAGGSSARVAEADKFISSLTLADASGLVGNYSIQGLAPAAGSALSNGLGYGAGVNTLTISPRQLSVSLNNTDVSKVYDGNSSATVGNGVSANAVFVPQFVVTNALSGDTFAAGNFIHAGAAYRNADGDLAADVLVATSLRVDGITIGGLTSNTANSLTSDYSWNTNTSVGAAITARPVAVAGTGVSKVYDGTTNMNQVTVGFIAVTGKFESGVVSGQALTVSGGIGAFTSADAGTSVGYSLTSSSGSPLVLTPGGSSLASNYSIPGGGAGTISGNDGVIYQRPLAITFTGDTKVYDGTTSATATASFANTAYAPVSGDNLTINRSAVYDTKNVGSDNGRVTVSGVSLAGADAANYTLTYSNTNSLHSPSVGSNAGFNTSASGSITQRDSVTWVGGATGDWFNPTNWALTSNTSVIGVVPDLANVATVVIPTGNTVNFSSAFSGSAEASQPVTVTTLQGDGATLNVSAGTLNVGSGGATVRTFAQTAGMIGGTGALAFTSSFSQTGGTIATTGSGADLTINQTTGTLAWRSISVGGDLSATSPAAMALGATTVGGNFIATTTNTAITQSAALAVTGATTLHAGTGDVTLNDAGNDFTGAVNVTAGATRLTDANNLSTVLTSTNDTTLAAGGNLDVEGTVTGATSDLTLSAGGKVTFGIITVDGNLSSTTRGAGSAGGVGQTGKVVIGGTASFIADTGSLQDAALTNAANDFQGAVSFSNATTLANTGSWRNVAVRDENSLALGNITATGALDATAAQNITLDGTIRANTLDLTATTGDITQSSGTLTVLTGPTNLRAGDDITLDRANDFNGTVNVLGGNDVTLNDTNSLTLGNVTTTGTLDATAATDITLDGTINVASLDLEATTGDITQGANGTLAVTNGPTNLRAGDDITLDRANDFNGTVNVLGGNDVTLNDTNSLTLGNVTTTGTLDATAATDIVLNGAINVASLDLEATTGDITQGANGTLAVTNGPTNLRAGDDITLDRANDFNGTVNADGTNITLQDVNGLTLGDVNAAGDLTLASVGPLDLGTSTVGGNLQAHSGGGNITQSGPLEVAGLSNFAAGSGAVELTNAGNLMPKGATIQAARYAIAGDGSRMAAAFESQVQGSRATVSLRGTGAVSATSPVALVMTSISASAPSNTGTTGLNENAASGITGDLNQARAPQAPSMVAVSLARGTSTMGTGFSFQLPQSIRELAQNGNPVEVSMADGSSLPSWLRVDPVTLNVQSMSVPYGGFPLQLTLTVASQRIVVVISERQE